MSNGCMHESTRLRGKWVTVGGVMALVWEDLCGWLWAGWWPLCSVVRPLKHVCVCVCVCEVYMSVRAGLSDPPSRAYVYVLVCVDFKWSAHQAHMCDCVHRAVTVWVACTKTCRPHSPGRSKGLSLSQGVKSQMVSQGPP